MRTNIYIDGFNLYYGCLKGTPYRWLDLRALCQRLLPSHQIHRIRYFTAKLTARAADPSQPVRQEAYLRAIKTLPEVTVHLGHYLCHPTRMQLAHPPPGGPATVEVLKTEEKGTDVNIAAYLLCDGFDKDYEQAVVISNDSDLKTPIELVRTKLRLPVGVVFPTALPGRYPSQALLPVATFTREIRATILPGCQFPQLVGGTIHKPESW
jgi:uncharacterized LabA/DUF88 family protein